MLVIDAAEGVTEQDAKIAGIAHDRGKATIIAVNKWDLIEKDNKTVNQFTQKIRQILSFMRRTHIRWSNKLSVPLYLFSFLSLMINLSGVPLNPKAPRI